MPTIEKRLAGGKTTYRAKVRLKGHPVESATFERKTDAERWAHGIEAEIREGRHFHMSAAKKHTLADLIDRYVREVLPQRPKSEATMAQQLRWWREQAGHLVLTDVTKAKLVELRDRLIHEPYQRSGMKQAKPHSPATVNRYMAVLSVALNTAVNEWEWLPENPLSKIKRQKEPRGRVRFLSDTERTALLEATKADAGLHVAFLLALTTGARRAEIWALRWAQVDFGRARITLEETKNGERRVLALAGPAMTALRDWSRVRLLDTDLVFPSATHNGWQPRDFSSPFHRALKVAGITDFHWHDLRHTTASYLAMNGATLAEIAEVLGHKTLQMVKRYSHMTEGHTAKVVGKMVGSVFGESA